MPALQRVVRTSNNLLARFHALWTLEGLGALDAALAREALHDPQPRLRMQALRASETLYKAGDHSFESDYRALLKDADIDVVIQAMLTMNVLKVADTPAAVKAILADNKARGVQFVADRIVSAAAAAARGGGRGGHDARAAELARARRHDLQRSLLRVPRPDGRGAPTPGGGTGSTLAPSLAGSPRVNGHRDYVIKAVLHGLSGPIDGRAYPQVMVAMGTNKDQWVADVASYVRNSFGNGGAFATAEDVARVRAAAGTRGPWTVHELEASLPHALVSDATWKVTASHDARPAPQAERRRRIQLREQCRRRAELHGMDDRRSAAAGHVVPDRAARAP